MRTVAAAVALLVFAATLTQGCVREVLPSRAFEVDVGATGANQDQVRGVARDYLVSKGFSKEAPNGYEEITKQNLGDNFRREPIIVSVMVHHPEVVLIRVSARDDFGPTATAIFEGLKHKLAALWPLALRDVP